MTPNEIISGLLAIARAAHHLVERADLTTMSLGAGDLNVLCQAVADLDKLPGEGNSVTRATDALQSFIESTGGNIAVPREVFAAAGRRVDPPQDRYAPNTIYTVSTDSTGKPVIYGSRSTSAPHEDTHIMEAALEFEQAKRLRGVEVQPHKVGNLWMTTIEPIEISHDFYTHRQTWRDAIQYRVDNGGPFKGTKECLDDESFWKHELKAFDRTFDTLPAEHPKGLRIFISDTVRDAMVAESIIAAQKVVNDANLLQQLRQMCGYVENGTSESVTISQDDATRDWSLYVGDSHARSTGKARRYSSTSFHQVIAVAARTELLPEPDECAEALNLAQPRTWQNINADFGKFGTAPAAPTDAQLKREKMNALLIQVKEKMGVAAAKSIITGTGKSLHFMASIPDDRIEAVIAECEKELAAERDHEDGQ